jgi:diguanylate cyclase (GGDEF)-like protein
MPKANILLIEDNALQAKQTIACLESAGYHLSWAETGLSGLKMAKTDRPDLILLDVVLPDNNGQDICRFIKADEAIRDIPIIMLTAKSELEDKVKGLTIGADDYLPKPFNEQELVAKINALLRIKSLQDELKKKNQELGEVLKTVERMAITDPGTGLFNRRHFTEFLEREFARAKRFNSPLACVMLDIDHFKQINDTYGHQTGDQVLYEIGHILQQNIRQIEIAARYGGEEFVLLLPETPLSEAVKPARRLLEQVAGHHFQGLDRNRMVTVSIGLSALPDPLIQTKDDLIRCADFALYKAKRGGRNRIETCSGSEAQQSETEPLA